MSRNYQSNTVAEGGREREQDIDGRVHPLDPLFVGTLRLIELLDPSLKHGKNGTGAVAGLQLGGQRMRGNVALCLLFVLFQSSCKYCLEACGRGGGRRNLRHCAS
jgi:hypothetical protein